MSNKTIGIVVGVIVVLGGLYFGFYRMGDKSSVENANTDTTSQTQNTNDQGKKMAFSQFLKQGGAYVCTVNQSVGGVDSQGTVYVNNGVVRGEFKSSVGGMNIDSNFMTKDGYSYSWSSAMAGKGFKVAVNNTGGDTSAGTSGSYSFNSDLIGDYDCDSWTLDSSKFDLPKGVVFTEIKQ